MMPMKRSAGQSWLPSIFNDFFDNNWVVKANATAPAINVMETDKEYKVEVAAPGMCKEDFDIHINKDNDLVITMEKKSKSSDCGCDGNISGNSTTDNNQEESVKEESVKEEKEGRYLRREFSYSKFQQTLILPDDVNRDEICAKMKNGVLKIRIPKVKPQAKIESVRSIEIN